MRHSDFHPQESLERYNFGWIEGYQFAGTDEILYKNYPDPGVPGRYFPRLRYVLVKPLHRNGRPINEEGKFLKPGEELVTHAVPMISNFDEGEKKYTYNDKQITYKWDYIVDLMDTHNVFNKNVNRKLKLWDVNQPDGCDVSYWYGIKANPFLITTWAQDRDLFFYDDYKYYTDHHWYNKQPFRDDGYDAAISMIKVNADPVRSKAFRVGKGIYGSESSTEGQDWGRHGCFCEIKYLTIEGVEAKREFMIFYDVEHKFYAFPTKARGLESPDDGTEANPLYGYVDLKYTKIVEVPWPDKVDGALIGKDLENHQYRPTWRFSHDGKHAVCIARIIDEPWKDGVISSKTIKKSLDGTVDLKSWYPILVELEFKIEVTGDALEDFTFEIKRKRVIDPEITGRSMVLADYAVRDFPDHNVVADDLIVLEYEMYVGEFTLPTMKMNTYYKQKVDFWLIPPDEVEGNIRYNYHDEGYRLVQAGYAEDDIERNPSFFEYGLDCSPVVTVKQGNYLIDPNKVTLAKVKNLGKKNIDGDVIFEWLAHYSSNYMDSYRPEGGDHEKIFVCIDKENYDLRVIDFPIKMKDWFTYLDLSDFEGNEGLPRYCRHAIFYHTAIQAIELNTLSFVLLPTLRLQGAHQCFDSGSSVNFYLFRNQTSSGRFRLNEESISGVLQVVYAFGKEDKELLKYAGHPLLKSEIESMFRQESSCPNWTWYTKFDLRGEIDAYPIEPSITKFKIEYKRTTYYYYYDEDGVLDRTVEEETDLGKDYEFIDDMTYLPLSLGFTYNEYHRVSSLQDGVFVRCNIQDLTIRYGDRTRSITRVMNCAELYERFGFSIMNGVSIPGFEHYFDIYKSIGNFTDDLYAAFTIGQKIFGYFDSFQQLRPGIVHRELSRPSYQGDHEFVDDKSVGNPGFIGFPFGKIHFQRVYDLTINPTSAAYNQFRTHPNGSWAVRMYPVIVFTEKHGTFRDYTRYSDGDDGYFYFEPKHTGAGDINYTQLNLDKIHLVYTRKDKITGVVEEFFKDTTHLKELNKAFDKNYTEKDYEYKLSKKDSTYSLYGDYSGGMRLESTWVCPLFNEFYDLIPNVRHGVFTVFDTSKPISPGLLYESFRIGFVLDNASNCTNNTRIHSCITSEFIDTGFDMQPQTPCMESLFYFHEPYIDREENRE